MKKMNNASFHRPLFRVSRQLLLSLFIFGALFQGCEDEPSLLGVDLIPDGDKNNIQFLFTNNVSSFSRQQERLPSPSPAFLTFGEFTDSLFGYSKASFNAQIFPTLRQVDFGEVPTADSMVFRFALSSTFGDTTNFPSIQVFELTDSIPGSLTSPDGYYDPSNPIFTGQPYYKVDSVTRTVGSQPQTVAVKTLNLNIGTDLATRFINADTTIYDSLAYFLDYFSGLHFEPVQQGNNQSLMVLNFEDNSTIIDMYYRNLSGDTLSFTFDFLQGGVRNQFFEHDYTNSPIANNLGDETNNDSLLYVQAMNGTEAVINLDNFEQWRDSVPIAINKAELTVYLEESLSNSVSKPGNMILLQKEEGVLVPLLDILSGQSIFGGVLDEETMSYTFNITRFVQSYIDGDSDITSLIMQPSANQTVPRRVVLKSEDTENKKIALKIMYTKL